MWCRGVVAIGRGTNQRDGSCPHVRQQAALLRPVEAVQLDDEEDGAHPGDPEAVPRLLHHPAHVRDAAGDGREFLEVPLGLVRDDVRERRLPAPRWPPQDDRGQPVAFDEPPQRPARPDDVLLPLVLLLTIYFSQYLPIHLGLHLEAFEIHQSMLHILVLLFGFEVYPCQPLKQDLYILSMIC